MEETTDVRYWCHLCSQVIDPVLEIEIKCPFCQTGFVEEMRSTTTTTTTSDSHSQDSDPDLGSDRALSRWAPVLINMMENPRRRFRRRRRLGIDDDFDLNDEVERRGIETQMDDELESIIRRRRRSSGAILQLLQGIRSEMASEGNNNLLQGPNNQNLDREQVILINPFNQTIVVRGSSNSSNGNQTPIGSLGDYLVGPGLDLLLQHLSENDPNRHGTPPASKEAIESMPIVKVDQHLNCSVCLDDFEIGAEAKEMPCKHKFHNGCITPWLELHSSCPVCRFQLPHNESKADRNENENSGTGSSTNSSSNDDGEEGRSRGAGRRFSIPWPFSGFFSSSSSSSSSSAAGNSSQTDEG